MKNKKGFTLIELLAVIVILAIIALIAVPIVLNMINNAKKGAAVSSAYGYIESIENYQALAQINSNEILKEGHYNVATKTDLKDSEGNVIKSVSKINSLVKMKGKKPSAGTIDIASNQQVSGATLCINGFVVRYLNQKSEVIADDCGDMDLITDLAVEKEGWQTERKLTINYPKGNYKYYYKVSGKAKVNDNLVEENKEIEATNPQVLMLEENQTVETWIIKNGNKIALTTYVEHMIDNVKLGIINSASISGVPTIEIDGINIKGNLSIDYQEQEGTSPYYSTDNGKTWIKYENEILVNSSNIKAKLMRNESKISTEPIDVIVSQSTNYLPEDGYLDNGKSYSLTDTNYKYLNVSSDMYGKKIKVHINKASATLLYVRTDNKDGSYKEEKPYSTSENGDLSFEYTISEDTTKIGFKSNIANRISISKIEVFGIGVFTTSKANVVPLLNSSGISKQYLLSLDTGDIKNVESYYSIDSGNTWIKYNDKVYLNTQNIKAKIKDIKTGKSTEPIDVIVSQSTNYLPEDGYLDNGKSYSLTDTNYKYLNVSSDMYGKKIKVHINKASATLLYVRTDNKDGSYKEEKPYSTSENGDLSFEYTISEDTTKIGFKSNIANRISISKIEVIS